jgi:hypothetical protein
VASSAVVGAVFFNAYSRIACSATVGIGVGRFGGESGTSAVRRRSCSRLSVVRASGMPLFALTASGSTFSSSP